VKETVAAQRVGIARVLFPFLLFGAAAPDLAKAAFGGNGGTLPGCSWVENVLR
jgi:hypothetical protein